MLSIGIPVFNQVATIRGTVESVLSQDHAADEIVVSDNHSTDGTADVLRYFGERIRVVRPIVHLGMAANWNHCISQLKSPWFSLLSGDDIARPRMVTDFTAAIKAHPAAVLMRGDWEEIDSEGNVTARRKLLSVSRVTRPSRTWSEQLLGPKVSFAAFAMRRKTWGEVGGFPTDYNLYADWAMWLRVASCGEFIHVPSVVAGYRVVARPSMDRARALLRIADERNIICGDIARLLSSDSHRLATVARVRLVDLLNYLVEQNVTVSAPQLLQLREIAATAQDGRMLDAWIARPSHIQPDWRTQSRRLLVRWVRLILPR